MKKMKQTLLWVGIYAIGMAFLESAVVVYLRNMYYPDGFTFPVAALDKDIAITEIIREAATIIMLISIGVLAAKKASERFAYFIYAFAIWDIFYYIFLVFLIGWPNSLMDWDILFLIPVTWFGPVITPILLAVMMIVLALVVIVFNRKLEKVKINWKEWALFVTGSIICIVSFTKEYVDYLLEFYSFPELFKTPTEDLITASLQFKPEVFPWWIYWTGFMIITSGIMHLWFRNRKAVKKLNLS